MDTTTTQVTPVTPVTPRVSMFDVPERKFDPAKHAASLGGMPKQDYAKQAAQAPPPPPPGTGAGPGAPTPEGYVPLSANSNRKMAEFIVKMVNKVQSNGFALMAGNGQPDVFAFSDGDVVDLTDNLAEGLPENWTLPWWVPFSIVLTMNGFGNWKKAQTIKKELKAEAEKLKAEKEKATSHGPRAASGPVPTPEDVRRKKADMLLRKQEQAAEKKRIAAKAKREAAKKTAPKK